MGNSAEKLLRKPLKMLSSATIAERVGKGLEKKVRTGASAARRTAQTELLKAKQTETAKLMEVEGEIAERKSLAKSGRGGRRSLIASSGGRSSNLGGTA